MQEIKSCILVLSSYSHVLSFSSQDLLLITAGIQARLLPDILSNLVWPFLSSPTNELTQHSTPYPEGFEHSLADVIFKK